VSRRRRSPRPRANRCTGVRRVAAIVGRSRWSR
jgi:hypothetical protein